MYGVAVMGHSPGVACSEACSHRCLCARCNRALAPVSLHGGVVREICEQRAWLAGRLPGAFFASRDMPGRSSEAVNTFLSREAAKPVSDAACLRVAPNLYWVPVRDAAGEVPRPSPRTILAQIAGAGWGVAGHAAGCAVGWLTHVTTRTVPVAVVGRPGLPRLFGLIEFRPRANERRRLLTPLEVAHIEAVSFFDVCGEVSWPEALRIAAKQPSRGDALRPDMLLHAADGEDGNGKRRLRERLADLCAVLSGASPPVADSTPTVWGGRPHLIEAAHLPALMGEGAWRARTTALSQFVKNWAQHPDARAAMCAAPPVGPNSLDLVRVAATVHALCARDGVDIPGWVRHHVWAEDVLLSERLPIDGKLGRAVTATPVAACAYHGVWFRESHIMDHRVHGFWSDGTRR